MVVVVVVVVVVVLGFGLIQEFEKPGQPRLSYQTKLDTASYI